MSVETMCCALRKKGRT